MRFEDWQDRLADAIAERSNTPFSYGEEHDCCLAASALIEAMTGDDWMEGFRGRYKSAAGAAKLLRKEGKGTLMKTVISIAPRFGSKRIPLAFAAKGDLVMTKKALHDQAQGQACGICDGRGKALFPGEIGWVQLPIRDWCAAFRVL